MERETYNVATFIDKLIQDCDKMIAVCTDNPTKETSLGFYKEIMELHPAIRQGIKETAETMKKVATEQFEKL